MMQPLSDRVALVTGVSRPIGIGAAIASRLHDEGATVVATGWPPHDAEMPWGEQTLPPAPFPVDHHDLGDADVPEALVEAVRAEHGRVDIVVAAHARSSHGGLDAVTAAELDRCWAVNVRSVLLLARALGRVHRPAPPGSPPTGRLLWFTSGQHHGPMDDEIAYAVSKGALHQMTASVAHALDGRRIVTNCINPGPVDTGYADEATRRRVAERFPDGEWGTPSDIAAVVAFLCSDAGAWIRGQVLDVDGGFPYR